jgi:hypothetical protein
MPNHLLFIFPTSWFMTTNSPVEDVEHLEDAVERDAAEGEAPLDAHVEARQRPAIEAVALAERAVGTDAGGPAERRLSRLQHIRPRDGVAFPLSPKAACQLLLT